MIIEELIRQLSLLNPKQGIEFRAYINEKKGYTDLAINDVRIKKGKIVMSNQCGVE